MGVLQGDDVFPALYRAADQSSLDGQRRFLRATRLRLAALVVAAIGGAFELSIGSLDVFGFVGLVAFVAALGAEIYVVTAKPDRIWYEGRAAAESAKTLAWRYAVGGEPFPVELDASEADRALLQRLGEVLEDLSELDMTPVLTADQQITPEMRSTRSSGLDTRKAAYDIDRVEDQRVWYSKKSEWNGERGRNWSLVALAIELAGIVAGAFKAFQVWHFDGLGLLAAIAAALTAWSQAKQYQTLNRAYFVASQELASIRSQIVRSMSEAEWAQFVQEAEEAISREHTLWRASRGVRLRRSG